MKSESIANCYPTAEVLVQHVTSTWQKANFEIPIFPEIASEALLLYSDQIAIDPVKVGKWICRTNPLPTQLQKTPAFGDPPVTLYWSDKFVVDIYYWLTPTTSIHDHAFCGAFSVIKGATLQTEYDFSDINVIDSQLKTGKLVKKDISLLGIGDIVKINPGQNLIHSTTHLVSPTISLCIRTNYDIGYKQAGYYPPYLSLYDSIDCKAVLLSSLLQLMPYYNEKDVVRLAMEIIETSDVKIAIDTLVTSSAILKDTTSVQSLIDVLTTRIPSLAGLLEDVILVFSRRMQFHIYNSNSIDFSIASELCGLTSSKAEALQALENLSSRKHSNNSMSFNMKQLVNFNLIQDDINKLYEKVKAF